MRAPGRITRWIAFAVLFASAYAGGATWAAFSAATSSASNTFAAVPDLTPPAFVRATVANTSGTPIAGEFPSGGAYHVYAQIAADTGAPASGTGWVTADVSAFDDGETAVPLWPGSWTVAGVSYNRRTSVARTADGGLTGGSTFPYTVRAFDFAGNGATSPAQTATVEACPTGPRTLVAGADAAAYEESPDTNYGNASTLYVYAMNGERRRTAVTYGLPPIPADCAVTSATLRMYNSGPEPGRTLEVYRNASVTSTESSLTWNTQPAAGGAPATATTPASPAWMTWDVTTQTQAHYASVNTGFQIRDAAEGPDAAEQRFDSREAANRPELVLTFD